MARKSARASETILSAAASTDAAGLLVLQLRGDGYDMGYQHGTLARERIRSLHTDVLSHIRSQADYPSAVPERATRSALRSMLTYQMARLRPLVPEEFWAEMEGIADGAGLTPYDILLLNALWEHVAKTACSHFATVAYASSPVHAVNLAVPEWSALEWAPYRVLLVARPAEGQPFAHVSLVGSVGVIAGLGANGMAVSWERRLGDALPVWRQAAAPHRPVGFTGRRIVQYAPNLHTAERLVRSDLPRPTVDTWLLSSARERALLGLEVALGQVAARHVGSTLVGSEGTFAKHNEQDGIGRQLWSLLTDPSQPSKPDADRAARILRDPYPAEGTGQWHPLTETICHPNTLFSAFMETGVGRIWAAAGEPPAPLGPYVGYSVNAADAPSSPERIPATGFGHSRQACVHLLSGEWEEALAQADRAAALDGETVPLALVRARALAGQGRHQEAAQALRPALAAGVSAPYRAMACHQLTQQHIALENAREAAKAAERRDALLRQSEGQVTVALPSAIEPVILLELSNWTVSEGRARE